VPVSEGAISRDVVLRNARDQLVPSMEEVFPVGKPDEPVLASSRMRRGCAGNSPRVVIIIITQRGGQDNITESPNFQGSSTMTLKGRGPPPHVLSTGHWRNRRYSEGYPDSCEDEHDGCEASGKKKKIENPLVKMFHQLHVSEKRARREAAYWIKRFLHCCCSLLLSARRRPTLALKLC